MAKDKQPKRKRDASRDKPKSKAGSKAGKKTPSKIKAAARKLKDKTAQAAADHPLVAELVAAALVGAAAALKDPAKARRLAESAADEITAAGKNTDAKGAALWLLALDIARRSVNSLADEGKAAKPAKKPAKKKKKGA